MIGDFFKNGTECCSYRFFSLLSVFLCVGMLWSPTVYGQQEADETRIVPITTDAAQAEMKRHLTNVRDGQSNPVQSNLTSEQIKSLNQVSPGVANAVRVLPGCTTNTLPANDDGSTAAITLPFSLNFFGTTRAQVFVNNNGNITFTGPLSTFTPFGLVGTNTPIIAPFFGDVDTRGVGSGLVQYGNTTVNGRTAFCVNYVNVGYYSANVDKLNTFQLILIDRADTGAAGNFDIEFNYNQIQWETGDASGGTGGLGGSPARVGYANGSTQPGASLELPGSGVTLALLDTNTTTGLTNNSLNSSERGRYIFLVRGGAVSTTPHRFDFDGDNKDDFGVFRPMASQSSPWYILRSTDNNINYLFWGLQNDKLVPADYDGDRRTDVAIFRNGLWAIYFGATRTFSLVQFGTTGDTPVPADYDGDGKADIAYFRTTGNRTSYSIRESSTGATRTVDFGLAGDVPVTGDWDGDGKADLCVYRVATTPGGQSYFYYRGSLNNPSNNFTAVAWGTNGDRQVAADYDGDGRVDPAVFRPSGVWYIRNTATGSIISRQFGLATDTPAPADYDGDNRTDIAVVRNYIWYYQRSSDNVVIGQQWGAAGDAIVEAAYLP